MANNYNRSNANGTDNQHSLSALLLPPTSPTSPTILLSQINDEREQQQNSTAARTEQNTDGERNETRRRKYCCCKRQIFTCLIIALPIAIPLLVYLKEIEAVKRVLEPAFVVFIAVLFTFSVVFIIRILGEASSTYWNSSLHSPTDETNTRNCAQNAARNYQRVYSTDVSHRLYVPTSDSNHYFCQPVSPSQRLAVHYQMTSRNGTPLNLAARRSVNISPISLRYSRSPSYRRGLRRARTPSPLYIHRSMNQGLISPIRAHSSPNSPIYSRLPAHYHYLSPANFLQNGANMKIDDPPPPYEKALNFPLAPLSPKCGTSKNVDENSKNDDSIVIDVDSMLADEAPPPKYDAQTMIPS